MERILVDKLGVIVIIDGSMEFTASARTIRVNITLVVLTASGIVSILILSIRMTTFSWLPQTVKSTFTTFIVRPPFNRFCVVAFSWEFRLELETNIVAVEVHIGVKQLRVQLISDESGSMLVDGAWTRISNELGIGWHELWEFNHPRLQIQVNLITFIDNEGSRVVIKTRR